MNKGRSLRVAVVAFLVIIFFFVVALMFLFLLFVFIRPLTKGKIGGYQAIREVRIKVFLDSFGACTMVRLAAAWQRQSACLRNCADVGRIL